MDQQSSDAQASKSEEASISATQEGNVWVRGLVMAFFVVVTRVVEIVVVAVLITQFIFKVATKKTNQRLTDFGESLSLYIASIVRYQTFNTEDKPFPFGAWPKVDRIVTNDDNDTVPPTQPQAL